MKPIRLRSKTVLHFGALSIGYEMWGFENHLANEEFINKDLISKTHFITRNIEEQVDLHVKNEFRRFS